MRICAHDSATNNHIINLKTIIRLKNTAHISYRITHSGIVLYCTVHWQSEMKSVQKSENKKNIEGQEKRGERGEEK